MMLLSLTMNFYILLKCALYAIKTKRKENCYEKSISTFFSSLFRFVSLYRPNWLNIYTANGPPANVPRINASSYKHKIHNIIRTYIHNIRRHHFRCFECYKRDIKNFPFFPSSFSMLRVCTYKFVRAPSLAFFVFFLFLYENKENFSFFYHLEYNLKRKKIRRINGWKRKSYSFILHQQQPEERQEQEQQRIPSV